MYSRICMSTTTTDDVNFGTYSVEVKNIRKL